MNSVNMYGVNIKSGDTQMNHTIGPWEEKIWDVYAASDRYVGAYIHVATINDAAPEAQANVRLIVAAPDMLEALNAAERLICSLHNAYYLSDRDLSEDATYQQICAALDKAEGR